MRYIIPLIVLTVVTINGKTKIYIPDPPHEVPCYRINPDIANKQQMCYISWGL